MRARQKNITFIPGRAQPVTVAPGAPRAWGFGGSAEFVSGFAGALDQEATDEQLVHVATLIPDEWLAPAATGTAARCVEAIRGQFELGCDGVILHGAGPAELAPIVLEYRATRSGAPFADLPANPGGRRYGGTA